MLVIRIDGSNYPLKLQSSANSLIWDGILIQSGSTPSSSTMAGRLSSLTFNTHLANFHYSSELVAMTRMLIWKRRIVTCYQRCDRGKEALTMSSRPPLGTTSRICWKSRPRITVFPPKIFSVAYASSNCIKSCRVWSIASKAQWRIIPNDQISFTHQLGHFHLLCDVASRLIMQINQNLESWMGSSATQKQQRYNS